MPVVILGITVLLAKLFPFGGQLFTLVLSMSGVLHGNRSAHAWLLGAMILANYIPAAIAATIFVRKAELERRLTKDIPGKTPILIGLALTALHLLASLFASTIEGGGASYVVAIYGGYLVFVVDILIVVGVARVLLAASPRSSAPSDA